MLRIRKPAARRARLPIWGAGEPEEIAEAILWLLSERASYTTGETLRVASGR